MLRQLVPPNIKLNDIYSFSFGICVQLLKRMLLRRHENAGSIEQMDRSGYSIPSDKCIATFPLLEMKVNLAIPLLLLFPPLFFFFFIK